MIKKISLLIIACITLPMLCMNENEKKFFEAVYNNNITAIQNLVKGGVNINKQDEDGNTALMIAIQISHNKLAQELLNMGADAGRQNHDGQTDLMLAIDNHNLEMVKLLLDSEDYSISIDREDKEKNTALMLAVQTDDPKIVEALLVYGPEPSSAMDFAKKNGRFRCQK